MGTAVDASAAVAEEVTLDLLEATD